jgi:hypothetical protein
MVPSQKREVNRRWWLTKMGSESRIRRLKWKMLEDRRAAI